MNSAYDPPTDAPGDRPPVGAPSALELGARDSAGADVNLSDTELFSVLDGLFTHAAATLGTDDAAVRALGLEAAIFGWVSWEQLHPTYTAPDVVDQLAARMLSPSERIRMRVGEYLWKQGGPAHRRHVGAAAAAAVEWARTLCATPDGEVRHHFLHGVRALECAAHLAVDGNQAPVVDDVCAFVVKLVKGAAAVGDAQAAALLTDLISELRKRYSHAQRLELLGLLTELHAPAMAANTPANPPILPGRLLEARRQLLLADGDEAGARACDCTQATLLAQNAARRPDGFVAAMDLRDAISFAERGQEDDAILNDYRILHRAAMEEGMANMPTIRITGRIPEELERQRQAMQDDILAQPIDEFLRRFGKVGLPTRALLEASVANARKSAPMTTLIPVVKIASAGEHVIGGSDEESLILRHGLRYVQINAQLELRSLWERRLATGDVTPDAATDFLRGSDNFDDEALDIIGAGITAAVNGEPVAAIHVLVPQLEDVLRQLLKRAGHDTSHRSRSNINVTEEISLGSIIKGLEERATITADQALCFRLVMEEVLGLNLRGRTGHGLLRLHDCTLENTLLVLQCYLVVASLASPPPHRRAASADAS